MSFIENISEKIFSIVSKKYMCCYFKDSTLNITSPVPILILYNPIYDYNPNNSFRVSINREHPFYEFLETLCDKSLHENYFGGISGEIVLSIDYDKTLKEKFLKGYIEENKSFIKMDLKVRKGYNKEYNCWFLKLDLNRFDFV